MQDQLPLLPDTPPPWPKLSEALRLLELYLRAEKAESDGADYYKRQLAGMGVLVMTREKWREE